MPLINQAKGEINAKIVYIGAAAAGKATNLNQIYSKLKEESRGSFKSMGLQDERMLFFDFMPSVQANVSGYSIRFHLYTITGAVTGTASWKMVLKGVDGLVFVADSDPARMSANLETLNHLRAGLAAYGKSLDTIPCVVQCNKRDLADAVGLEEIANLLNMGKHLLVPASAAKGEGVLEAVFPLVKMVIHDIRSGGLELNVQSAQIAGLTVSAAGSEEELQSVSAADADADAVGTPATDSGIESPRPSAAVASSIGEALLPAEEPLLEISEGIEALAGGGMRLPVSVRYAGGVKRVMLTISLTPIND